MRDDTMDVLLRIGMQASAKGLTYICDAIELFDTDPFYPEGKICSLYNDIAHRHDTTSSRVERAIRHAFDAAITRGDKKLLGQYLDVANTQNSNLLRSLYFRLKREKKNRCKTCNVENCVVKEQIYQEAMVSFYKDIEGMMARRMKMV